MADTRATNQRVLASWLFLALLLASSSHVNSFTARPESTSSHYLGTQKTSRTLVHYSEEDSEWYCPPPPKPTAPKIPKGAVPSIREIRSNVELLEFINEDDDRLCVVKFYASWCKSCQKFNLHFNKFAREEADWVDAQTGELIQKNNIRVATVEYSVNRQLCDSLGVEKLPTCFLYGNGRKLTEVSVGASKFDKVREAVKQYANFSKEDQDFAATIEAGADLIKNNVLTAPPKTATIPNKPTTPPAVESKVERLAAQLAAAPANAAPPKRRQWWKKKPSETN